MALKFNNNNVTTLASAEIIDFAGYSKPTDIDPHDITIYANWMQGREDNDTELKFHITNNSGYDFNVDAACCEASGAAVGFASIGCPDREETILQWENYVISQNTTGYFSFTFRPLSGVNARPLMINIPFTRYNEPETSTSTEADLWE